MNIATVVTSVAISTSFISIILVFNGRIFLSIVFGLFSFLIDCLDGFIARSIHTESRIGRQFDSMSDALIYLLWPALLYYSYFQLRDAFSLVVLCFFISAGLYRLARFNDVGMVTSKFGIAYPGIPVVFSHVIILFFLFLQLIFHPAVIFLQLIILLHSFTMISYIPFPKPPTFYVVILLIISIGILFIYGPYIAH